MDALANAEPMDGLALERLEDEHVKRALEQVGFLHGSLLFYQNIEGSLVYSLSVVKGSLDALAEPPPQGRFWRTNSTCGGSASGHDGVFGWTGRLTGNGWAIGAVASASALHAVGRGFESLIAHHFSGPGSIRASRGSTMTDHFLRRTRIIALALMWLGATVLRAADSGGLPTVDEDFSSRGGGSRSLAGWSIMIFGTNTVLSGGRWCRILARPAS